MRTVFPVLDLLLIALPNRWYGLRLPATFADEQVWYDANAVGGRDMMLLGAVLVVSPSGCREWPGCRAKAASVWVPASWVRARSS